MIEDKLLGKPLIQRKEYINKLRNADPYMETPIFSGEGRPKEQLVPVYMVDIDVPIYRLKNIRTKSPQKSLVTKNNLKEDFFTNDVEDRDALQKQQQLLLQIANTGEEKNHVTTFTNTGYDKAHPMIMTNDGILVNGNTRMSAIRYLYNQDKVSFKRFEQIPIAILPEHFSEPDYRQLELHLQINPDIKKDYSWISEAIDCDEQIASGMSLNELSTAYKRKKSEIRHPENLINQLSMANLYLKDKKEVGNYDSLPEKSQYAFDAWYSWRSKYDNDLQKRNLCDYLCLQLISNKNQLSDKGLTGDLNKIIRKKQKEYIQDPSQWTTLINQFRVDAEIKDENNGQIEKSEDSEVETTDELNSEEQNEKDDQNNGQVEKSKDSEVETTDELNSEEQNEKDDQNNGQVEKSEDSEVETTDELNSEEHNEETDDNEKTQDGFSWLDKYEDPEKKNAENSKQEKNVVDTEEIIKKLKKKGFSPIDSMINVQSTRAEEKKRASDKSLVYNDAVQINSNINDCITRLNSSENVDFEKLNEAKEELEKSRENIDTLIKLLKSKI